MGSQVDPNLPHGFTIELYVDVSETNRRSPLAYQNQDKMFNIINDEYGFPCSRRHLGIGDYMWVAKGQNGEHLVLPLIVERKGIDDLDRSIIDGRYQEQKDRLKKSGIEHRIYLVEGNIRDLAMMRNFGRQGVSISGIRQALFETEAVGFLMLRTKNIRDTAAHLRELTSKLADFIRKNYAHEQLEFLNFCKWRQFDDFNKSFAKTEFRKAKTGKEQLGLMLRAFLGPKAAAKVTNEFSSITQLIRCALGNESDIFKKKNVCSAKNSTRLWNLLTKDYY